MTARRKSGSDAARGFVHIDIVRFNFQNSAAGHRVARIQAKIHQNLLDLRRVGANGGELSGQEKF